MNRKLLITIHMYLSAFFAPAVLLVAISGGLYLIGIKGDVDKESIFSSSEISLDANSSALKKEVSDLLARASVQDYSFEYVKVKGSTLYTRPTSTKHYVINLLDDGVEVVRAKPNLQSRMVELHKGHGPTLFKTFQKIFALGLVLIILSGLWLGISAARLRNSTLITAGAGAVVFIILLL